MKKLLLTILASLLLLCGCSKKVSWDEVQNVFKDAEKQAQDNINTDIILKEDYQGLITELNAYLGDIEFSQDQDNQDTLKKAYRVAEYIELFASLFNGNCAQQLLTLAGNTKGLVKSIYDGNKDEFNSLKTTIDNEIYEISSWADDEWSTIEKKARLVWSDVQTQIEQLQEQAKESIEEFDSVAETELENLKHTIIDNYQLIKDGVTEDTDAIAKKMYTAAVQLREYTRYIDGEQADKVWEFAKHAQAYIEERYGKTLDEDEKLEQDFSVDAEDAAKWTQSTWNEITRNLKLKFRQQ